MPSEALLAPRELAVADAVHLKVSSMRELFRALDAGLVRGEALWRPQPWRQPRVPWRTTHAALHRDVLALSDDDFERLHSSEEAMHEWMCDRVPDFQPCAEVTQRLHELAAESQRHCARNKPPMGSRGHVGVPGKKWRQVEGFATAMPKRRVPAVEWCAGKGFLSQRLVAHGAATSSICMEVDPALCRTGRRLASLSALPLEFVERDVLGPEPLPPSVSSPPYATRAAHVALHACGELHRTMLRAAVDMGAPQVAVAPCCYHKHLPLRARWRPLSAVAAKSRLALETEDLKLASAGERAARRRDHRLRRRELEWRRAFAAWHRRAYAAEARRGERRGEGLDWKRASRLPSVPLPVLSQGSSAEGTLASFERFCRWAVTADGESLPARQGLTRALEEDWSEREAAICLRVGAAEARRLARLELVRQAYRRPLELWLVLDVALFLEEDGYGVSLTELCERSASSRNLLVTGERRAAGSEG